MNKKGSAVTIILVFLVIILIVIFGYSFISKKSNSNDQSEVSDIQENDNLNNDTNNSTVSTEQESDLKTYSNSKYGFEIKYPSDFTFHDSESSPDVWTLSKLRPDRVIKNVGCGGFIRQPDEVELSWLIFSRENFYKDFTIDSSDYITTTIGDKTLKIKRSIPGMCEDSDNLLWIEPTGRFVVSFNIRPSNTKLVEEYKAIIESFRFY